MKVEHPYWHDNALVALVNEVPCWVCQLCGHRFFDAGVENHLELIVEDYIRLGQTFPIPKVLYKIREAQLL